MIIHLDKTKLHLVDFFRKTEALELFEAYKRSQWWPYEKIVARQLEKIRSLLSHAYTNVPYYRRLFDENGVKPEAIRTLGDFRGLPLLSKETVRAAGDRMLAKNKERFKPHRKATGGSTGRPLTYYMDKKSRSAQWAHIYRLWNTAGWDPGDRMVVLGGTSLTPSAYAVKKWFYVKLNNWLLLSAFGMSDESMQQWVGKLRGFKARYLHAYASSAYLLAKFLQDNHITDIRFHAVFTTAEVLQPKYRETIERVFDCRVYDFYGAADGGAFAFECEKQEGLHCVSESCFVEIVAENGRLAEPGEIGEVVTTDLNNYAMPFIRYKLGDKGTFAAHACACGRGLPLLQTIIGRTPDFIESRAGERYHEEFFSYLFKDVAWIAQFCVVQENRLELWVYLKPDRPPSEAEIERMRRFLSKKFPGMRLEIKVTDSLPVSANGKFKYIINKTTHQN
ncbi:MAG: phenylacetate--CoA ligase family protein [bacterium]